MIFFPFKLNSKVSWNFTETNHKVYTKCLSDLQCLITGVQVQIFELTGPFTRPCSFRVTGA